MGAAWSCDCCYFLRKHDDFTINELPHPPYVLPEDIHNIVRQGVLTIQGINFCIETNGKSHHTAKYHVMTRREDKCLVVRRGQPFQMEILLNRPYNAKVDSISFIFNVSDVESHGPSDITLAAMPLLEEGSTDKEAWHATYEGQTGSGIMVSVTAAAECIVAPWKFDIDTKLTGNSSSSVSYLHPLPIYVLFNPWCQNDSVFMPAQNHREEFVEYDGGLLFRGAYNRISPMGWNFAQYEEDILECSFYVAVKIGKLKGKARSDPIKTTRALSAAVNANDDRGVIWGKWSDDDGYSDGVNPTKWLGSLIILQNYYKTKKPVKYAQCWVFAGLLTTICRALGIPCRPVTGFEAAHDSLGSLTIDYFIDAEGNLLEHLGNDSIWNFHVWNEVWMKRPDLGNGFDGWQVIDSTPQEMSGGMFRCGPTSMQAVKEGEVERPYDASFVFAQVNADEVFWKYSGKTKPLKLISRNAVHIGQNISTKAVGQMKREDITSLYKYPERSQRERAIFEKALRRSENIFARYYLNDAFNDINFSLELNDDITMGQNFTVVLKMMSRASVEPHQVTGVLQVHTITYKGEIVEKVKRLNFDLNVAPASEELVTMLVHFKDYYKKLVSQAAFHITCMAKIVNIDYDYFAQDTFRVRNPDIAISLDSKPVHRHKMKAVARLKNPLPIHINNPKFYIQGPGLHKQLKIKLNEKVAPGAVCKAEFEVQPEWTGRHQITAKLSSKALSDVDGYISFEVKQ